MRLTGAVCAVLVGCAIWGAAAQAAGGPANWTYEPTSFTEIHLTLPPASITKLEAEPKEYVEGTFELAETAGTPGSAGPFSAPLKVGIELKGNLGSLRRLSEKAAFKIKFDKYVEGQRFLGPGKDDLEQHGPGPVDDPRDGHLRGLPRHGGAGAAHGVHLPDRQRQELRRPPEHRNAGRPVGGKRLRHAILGAAAAPLRGGIRRGRDDRELGSARSVGGQEEKPGRQSRPRSVRRGGGRERWLLPAGRRGRRPERDDQGLDGRKVRRQLGRLRRDRAGPVPPEQLLPLQRRGGEVLADAVGDRPDLAGRPAPGLRQRRGHPLQRLPRGHRRLPAAVPRRGPRSVDRPERLGPR